MGTFSWLKADEGTRYANIYEGCKFKFLIPMEFGGGFIKDEYRGYGKLGLMEDGTAKYDMYELLAIWNHPNLGEIRESLMRENNGMCLKEVDQYTDKLRDAGIDIGCYDEDMIQLKYPLKLVSASYGGTYEECEGVSLNDSYQGMGKMKR